MSAELKMLKFLQERVNKKTKQVEALGVDEGAQQADYDQVSKKQARVKELMRRLAEKLGKEDEGEGN
ncbi:MAG: hypothetical protein ACON4Z_04185 [Planctomycetota bacterium]